MIKSIVKNKCENYIFLRSRLIFNKWKAYTKQQKNALTSVVSGVNKTLKFEALKKIKVYSRQIFKRANEERICDKLAKVGKIIYQKYFFNQWRSWMALTMFKKTLDDAES